MTIQDFYARLDDACVAMRGVGMQAEAARIRRLLHVIAWTSPSELFKELDKALREILASPQAASLPDGLRQDVEGYIALLADWLTR